VQVIDENNYKPAIFRWWYIPIINPLGKEKGEGYNRMLFLPPLVL
jgi:hypothetical protein